MEEFIIDEISINEIQKEKETHQFEELTKKIIGAAILVHRELGSGYVESIYEEAVKVEFTEHSFSFESEKEITIKYLGVVVGVHRLDLVVENQVIVELKAVKELTDMHFA